MDIPGAIVLGIIAACVLVYLIRRLIEAIKESSPETKKLQEELNHLIAKNRQQGLQLLEKQTQLTSEKNMMVYDMTKMRHITTQYENLKSSIESNEKSVLSRVSILFGDQAVENLHGILTTEKYRRAIEGDFSLASPITVSCLINSDETVYKTTLTTCTCKDFKYRNNPCKHMLWLGLQVGLLVRDDCTYQASLDNLERKVSAIQNKENTYKEHIEALQKQRDKFESDRNNFLYELEAKRKHIEEKEKILHEEEQAYPYMANLLTMYDQEVDKIRLKKMDSRAYKSSEVVKTIKAEKKELLLERNLLRNQLLTYESLFPWLEEFKEVNVTDAVQYATEASGNDDYETVVKKWLSPEEFARLSRKEKLQLALDRYQHRQKTDWEIGIEYERYIGFLYESKGYTVKYTGATMGLHDMGRDILAEKDGQVLVIQCKRWAADKTIHEKHIFQLFGTSFIMHLQDPEKEYTPVFYTTATLSELAAQCSSGLNIRTYEKYPFGDYPLIKCNVGHDENGLPTKIYHLPFDQQYDRIIIDPSKGERYAATIEEAERAGFRHAYKWSGT